MSDRELLELAAKAAQVEVLCWSDGLEPYSSGEGLVLPSNRIWNPLTDDGDALRLAVRLGISVQLKDPERLAVLHSPEVDARQEGHAVATIDGRRHWAPGVRGRYFIVRWVSMAEFERVANCKDSASQKFWRDNSPQKFENAYTATRRAIVLAAAVMANSIPSQEV